MSPAARTDKQIKEEIAALKSELAFRRRARAAKKYLAREAKLKITKNNS